MSKLYCIPGLLLLMGMTPANPAQVAQGCRTPHTTESAGCFVDGYAVGTRGRYVCKKGFHTKLGESSLLECSNKSGRTQWTYFSDSLCEADSESPVLVKGKTQQDGCSRPQLTHQQPMEGFCGDPKPHENATIKITLYVVGQELQYQCLEGYRGKSCSAEVSTCKKSNKGTAWTAVALRCTNDTYDRGESIEPVSKVVFFMAVFTTLISL